MSLVGRFEHLPNRPRSDEARPLLEKIASQVKPIMSKRDWNVGTLAEFLPSNPALLGNNMNAGQRINLRLRPPGATSTFYEYDQLVLVMLHELTHIEHGPHNAQFYKLLAELEEEYWDLKRKGFSGEGFHSAGRAVSGFKLSDYDGRKKGMEAAQKRLDVQRKIGRGGVLGGTSTTAGKSMKDVLADAAERRMRDDKACHTDNAGHQQEVEEEVRRAQEESVGVDAKDLSPAGADGESINGPATSPSAEMFTSPNTLPKISTSRVPPTIPFVPAPQSKLSITAPRQSKLMTPSIAPAQRPKPPRPPSLASDPFMPGSSDWPCPTCTLLNPPLALQCEACAGPRPIGRGVPQGGQGGGDVWYCEFCGGGPREMGFWSCTECGWVRKWG